MRHTARYGTFMNHGSFIIYDGATSNAFKRAWFGTRDFHGGSNCCNGYCHCSEKAQKKRHKSIPYYKNEELCGNISSTQQIIQHSNLLRLALGAICGPLCMALSSMIFSKEKDWTSLFLQSAVMLP